MKKYSVVSSNRYFGRSIRCYAPPQNCCAPDGLDGVVTFEAEVKYQRCRSCRSCQYRELQCYQRYRLQYDPSLTFCRFFNHLGIQHCSFRCPVEGFPGHSVDGHFAFAADNVVVTTTSHTTKKVCVLVRTGTLGS